jgi:acetyl esterase/lipase
MEQMIKQMREGMASSDAKRDAGLTIPEDVTRYLDLRYGDFAENLLDVYCPKGTAAPLPTIVSIHGGGWIYGDKELYSHYCMRLAQRGFTVVNFTYRLAPEHKYPAAVQDTCAVMAWMQAHAEEYFIDLNNIFMLGDSAGGQLCHQVLTLLTNPQYAALFDFAPPKDFRVNACALNCGCYFLPFNRFVSPKRCGAMMQAYFPEDYVPLLKQLKPHKFTDRNFPPAIVMSAANDFLKHMAKPMYRLLRRRGVETQLHIYGTKAQKEIGHVFHVNCKLPLAAQCNDEQCAFFRAHMVGENVTDGAGSG